MKEQGPWRLRSVPAKFGKPNLGFLIISESVRRRGCRALVEVCRVLPISMLIELSKLCISIS